MKIVKPHRDLLDVGGASLHPQVRKALKGVEDAIHAVDWPHGSGRFVIRPVRRENGVLPIKVPCIGCLRDAGWQIESLPDLKDRVLTSGDLDGLYRFEDAKGRTRYVVCVL